MTTRSEQIAALARRLRLEKNYGNVASEALARAWVKLGDDRGWSFDELQALALEAADAGVLPDSVRIVTELTGRILSIGPATPAKRPQAQPRPTPRKASPA